MPSFDILSEPDSHEVKNAVDQATRELTQRFDFRGTSSEIITSDDGFELKANSEDRVKAIWEVLRDKFVKRKLSLKFLEGKAVVPVGGSAYKMSVVLKKGIDKEHAKFFGSGHKRRKITQSYRVHPRRRSACYR